MLLNLIIFSDKFYVGIASLIAQYSWLLLKIHLFLYILEKSAHFLLFVESVGHG